MGKKACCFYFGKRKFNFESLKPTLKSEIEKLVATFNVTEFYVCAQNEFDNLCIETSYKKSRVKNEKYQREEEEGGVGK